VARSPADDLGRGRGDRAPAARTLGVVFFTLKDPADGSCVGVAMARGRFDALRLDLADGERVHVFGRPELYEQRGEFKLARSRSSASASAPTSPRSSA
jgi:exonuclease VII large subunit